MWKVVRMPGGDPAPWWKPVDWAEEKMHVQTELSRLWPYLNKFAARVKPYRPLDAYAHKTTVLRETERMPVAKTFFLPNQIDRIKGTYERGDLSKEIDYLTSEWSTQVATIEYEIGPAFVHEHGYSILGQDYNVYDRIDHARILTQPIVHLPRAHYCMNTHAHQFFGHWLRNATGTALLAPPDAALILHRPDAWPHAAQYTDLFELQPHDGSLFFVEQLTVYQDFAQGSDRAARYAELRKRLRRNLPSRQPSKKKVFLRRGSTGAARSIKNEDALIKWMADNDFVVTEIAGKSVAEIAADLLDAEIVVTMEGSHINHAHFLMDGDGLLLVLNPATRFNCTHFHVADALGTKTATLVVDGDKTEGFTVDIPELEQTIALALR